MEENPTKRKKRGGGKGKPVLSRGRSRGKSNAREKLPSVSTEEPDSAWFRLPFAVNPSTSPPKRTASTKSTQPPSASRKGTTRHSTTGPFAQLYGGETDIVPMSELAVHHGKVKAVDAWLDAFFCNPHRPQAKVLVLTGPAGCGKTATIRSISKAKGYAVVEWINPVSQQEINFQWGSTSWVSQQAQFESFLRRSQRYRTLSFGAPATSRAARSPQTQQLPPSSSSSSSSPPSSSQSSSSIAMTTSPPSLPTRMASKSQVVSTQSHQRQLVLIEDLPNFLFQRSSAALFHDLLRGYCSRATCPAVFVLSDCETAGRSSASSFLFPPAIEASGIITHIKFNPITPRAVEKVLVSMSSKFHLQLTRDTLKEIAETSNGDIRGAINALLFSCDKAIGAPQQRVRRAGRRGGYKRPSSSASSSSLSARGSRSKYAAKGIRSSSDQANEGLSINGRDSSLKLFHSLGRLLRAKRTAPPADVVQQHPSRHCRRQKAATSHPFSIIPSSSSSIESGGLRRLRSSSTLADDEDSVFVIDESTDSEAESETDPHEKTLKRAAITVGGGRKVAKSTFILRTNSRPAPLLKSPVAATTLTSSTPDIKSALARNPLDASTSPEETWRLSHMSADRFAVFLHQNYMDFYSDFDDIVSASNMFSEMDLLHSTSYEGTRMDGLRGSVLSRGIVYHNTKPKTSGWKPLKKPAHFEAAKTSRDNASEFSRVFKGRLSASQCPAIALCTSREGTTTVLPLLKYSSAVARNTTPEQRLVMRLLTTFTPTSRFSGFHTFTDADVLDVDGDAADDPNVDAERSAAAEEVKPVSLPPSQRPGASEQHHLLENNELVTSRVPLQAQDASVGVEDIDDSSGEDDW